MLKVGERWDARDADDAEVSPKESEVFLAVFFCHFFCGGETAKTASHGCFLFVVSSAISMISVCCSIPLLYFKIAPNMLTRSFSTLLRRPSSLGLAPTKLKNVRFGGGGGGFVSKKRKPGEWDVEAEEHLAGTFDTVMAKVLGVTLWLWIFTSMKADNGKFLVCLDTLRE